MQIQNQQSLKQHCHYLWIREDSVPEMTQNVLLRISHLQQEYQSDFSLPNEMNFLWENHSFHKPLTTNDN